MSGPLRLAMFASLLWVGTWLMLSLTDYSFPWVFFLAVGIVPAAFLWGIGWVVVGFKRSSSSPKRSDSNRAGFHIGWPDQAAAFAKRNPLFVKRLERLRATFDVICNRDFTTVEHIDSLVFIAGYLTVDDFMEILIL